MADTRVRIWVCLLRSACMNTNMTPTFNFSVFRYGFLPRHSFRVCCTLHPDLPCGPYCRASFYFPTWAVFFRSQFARFAIALHRPDGSLSFGQLSCVRILVCSPPCSVFAPVSSTWRTHDISPFVFLPPILYRSAHIVPLQFVLLYFSFIVFSSGTFSISHAELPAYLYCGKTPTAIGQYFDARFSSFLVVCFS